MLESVETRRTISFCWASRVDNWEAEMFGCGGSAVSIADASFDFATDDGRVSGSNRAFRTRASFADNVEGGAETAMSDDVANVLSLSPIRNYANNSEALRS